MVPYCGSDFVWHLYWGWKKLFPWSWAMELETYHVFLELGIVLVFSHWLCSNGTTVVAQLVSLLLDRKSLFWSRVSFRIWCDRILGTTLYPQQVPVRIYKKGWQKEGIGCDYCLLILPASLTKYCHVTLNFLGTLLLLFFSVNSSIHTLLSFTKSHSFFFTGIIIYRYCCTVGMPTLPRLPLVSFLWQWTTESMPSCTFITFWWQSNASQNGSTVFGLQWPKYRKWWWE